MKKTYIIVGVIIVAVVIAFFSFFWPMNDSSDLKGTIGGVEKAKKFRGEQMDASDILVDNEEFNTLIQSAEWQNAMKNEELVAFLQSDDFQKIMNIQADLQKIVLLNFYFNTAKSTLMEEPELNEEVVKSILNQNSKESFVALMNQDFQYMVSQDFQYMVSQDFQNVFMSNLDNIEDLSIIDLVRSLLNNNSSLQAVFSMDMQKFVYSKDFEKFVLSQDYQNTVIQLNQDFQNTMVPLSQDFQQSLMNSQDFQVLMKSALSLHIFTNNQDFQKNWLVSQDFQNIYMSQDFQALIQSALSYVWPLPNNQDFEQNMLGAFQDYMNIILMSH
jgi:hypothetical protein